jgi:hypothetical protein
MNQNIINNFLDNLSQKIQKQSIGIVVEKNYLQQIIKVYV